MPGPDSGRIQINTNLSGFLVFATAIVLSQALLALFPKPGLYIVALAFVVLMGLGLIFVQARPLAISCSIIFVANIVAIGVNPHHVLSATALYVGTILLLAVIYRYIFDPHIFSKAHHFSFEQYRALLPQMIIMGQIIGVLGYLTLKHHYAYGHINGWLIGGVVLAFAMAEEYLLRGLIQKQALHIFHPVIAALLSVLTGVCLYFNHYFWIALPAVLLLQISCATVYNYKQNLFLTITLNAAAKLSYVGLITAFVLH